MKIAFFADAYKPITSGVTTSLFMLVEGLIKEGHEVTVFTTKTKKSKEYDQDKPYIKRFRGIPIPRKGLNIYRLIPFKRRFLKQIKKEGPFDVVHIHTEFSIGKLGNLYKKKTGTPMVFTVHTMYEEYLHYVGKTITKIFKRAFMYNLKKLMRSFIVNSEVTITPSNKIKDLMLSYNIEGNYKIVPTGIPLKKFKRTTYTDAQIKELKRSLGLSNEFICLYVGRVSKEKSIDVLLEGFKEANLHNTKFVIVGDGPQFKELNDLVTKLNLQERVIFTGMVDWDKVGLYYQIGDCFLNASISETQGLTYIEALAAGLPLLVKYDKVLEAVVIHENNGLFFHKNEELPRLIIQMKEDIELTAKLKKNAILSVKKYSQEVYVKSALETYQEAIVINQET